MMEYRGYKAQIDFDDEAGCFVGEVINSRYLMHFSGRSVEELRTALKGAVDAYLDLCAIHGDVPSGLPPGRLSIQLRPDLHRSIVAAAAREGKAVQTWITERLSEAAGGASPV